MNNTCIAQRGVLITRDRYVANVPSFYKMWMKLYHM